MKSLRGSKHGYHHSAQVGGIKSFVGVGLVALEIGFYRRMSSRHGSRVRMVQ